ncbi:MAG: hypothetical protein HRT57_12025 [Crocinitomicaceae bacterium]|nr:hypothetical protein [Crocinitomicaceae bacterium]
MGAKHFFGTGSTINPVIGLQGGYYYQLDLYDGVNGYETDYFEYLNHNHTPGIAPSIGLAFENEFRIEAV